MTGSRVKIGLVQMHMSRKHDENLARAILGVRKAASKGAQIVCLPELFLSRYFPQKENSKEKPMTIPNSFIRVLASAAKENKVVLVAGSIYERSGKKSYNTCVIFNDDGSVIGKYRKVHIPQDPSFYEKRYFSSGTKFEVFQTKYARVGLLICFDQWYPEPARVERLLGANIIFYPTAIGWVKGIEPVEGNWHTAWERVQVGHAISNSVIVASVNRVGVEGDMKFWGGSFVCNQFGKILVRGDDKEGVLVASCDLSLGRNVEEGWGFLRNRVPRTYSYLVK